MSKWLGKELPNKCRNYCIIENFYKNGIVCVIGWKFVCLNVWGCGIELGCVRKDLDGFRSVFAGL